MDRRSLLDGDATPTQEHANIFGDEFEVEDFDFVADGFRPNVDVARDETSSRQDQVGEEEEPIRTISAHYAPNPVSPMMSSGPSRNSTRKSRSNMDPFASPEDDEPSHSERPQSLEFEPDTIARRSVSSASSGVYASTSSPRFGAGPSHPYGMYQQGTMARSPSTATTSTIRPGPRQSYSQNRPQHPYAMYPQGVGEDMDDEDDDIEPIQQNPVPVGFPGLGQSYTRRLGPDGEDQDIIGEDGHTEQLPPYTRYPEDGPEKMPLLVPSLPTALHSRAPVAGTDPGMPLMHTTLQPTPTPAPQSMTDGSVLDRQASRSSDSHAALLSSSSSDSTSIRAAKKAWRDKTWKEKRKTRFCGIPFWWILLAICVIAFIAAVLGGVIGGFVAGGHPNKPTVTVVTSLYDASPIASPTGAPPTGTFALTLGPPEEAQCDCLPQANQKIAWSCDLAPNAALGLNVGPPANGKGSGANVFYASYDTSIAYGAQLNNMNTSFAQFMTVRDNDDPDNGPAFYFQQFYDKVVVIPEEAISVQDSSDSNKRKRGFYSPGFRLPEAWAQRREVVPPGERPWFCVWNSTFLEGFIYISESASSSTTSSATPTSPPNNGTTPPPLSQKITGYHTPSPTTPPPTDIMTSTFAAPFTTATYTGPSSNYPAWVSGKVQEALHRTHGGGNAEDKYHPLYTKRQEPPLDLWNTLDAFPYVIKLEERRLAGNPVQPYCQQYQILDSMAANFVLDDDGDPIIVELDEQDPTYAKVTQEARRARKRGGDVQGECHCQWMSGEQLSGMRR